MRTKRYNKNINLFKSKKLFTYYNKKDSKKQKNINNIKNNIINNINNIYIKKRNKIKL